MTVAGGRAEEPPRPLGLRVRLEFEQALQGRGRLVLGRIRATQRGQAGGELDPRLGRLERRTAPLEAVYGVL